MREHGVYGETAVSRLHPLDDDPGGLEDMPCVVKRHEISYRMAAHQGLRSPAHPV
jgi:hypothetical protein